jgi:hypothetical protein
MDKETLLTHHSQWGWEERPSNRELSHLRDKEQEVYNLLVNDALSERLRLEQEEISYESVKTVLKQDMNCTFVNR